MVAKGDKYIVKLNNRRLSKGVDRMNHEASTTNQNHDGGTNTDKRWNERGKSDGMVTRACSDSG